MVEQVYEVLPQMFEKVSRKLKYDSKVFLVHKHIIPMDTNNHFTPLTLCMWGNERGRNKITAQKKEEKHKFSVKCSRDQRGGYRRSR